MESMRFTRRSRMALVWLTVLLFALAAKAQVDTGTILGTVTDSTGAIVPGATLTLRNQATAARLTDKTTADGRFEFTPLPIGTYTVVVEAPSFKKTTIESVRLSIQQQAAVNVVLQPGAVTENVEVTEAPELMQTQSSSVGQVLEEKTIEDLPLNGRDYTMLVMLTPRSEERRVGEECRSRWAP